MAVLTLTDESFDAAIASSTELVVVDFWAAWCGPCKQVAPIIEELGEELTGAITFAKVDIDEAFATAGRLNIMSVPTIAIFKGGQLVASIAGARSKSALLAAINNALA
jgi:thioredoxin 1